MIVRHLFHEAGAVQTVDAFFAHLNAIRVQTGQRIRRGQQIGTIGTAHGLYLAHLHFEMRKNLNIGIRRAAFPQNFSCYYDPTKFINAHRHRDAPSTSEGLFTADRTLSLALRRKAFHPLSNAGETSCPPLEGMPPNESA